MFLHMQKNNFFLLKFPCLPFNWLKKKEKLHILCAQAFEELIPVSVSAMILVSIILLASHSRFNPSFIAFPYNCSCLKAGFAWLEHRLPFISDCSLFFHYASTFLKDFRTWISPQPVSLCVIVAIISTVQVSNPSSSVSLYFTSFLFYSDLQTTQQLSSVTKLCYHL